MLALINSVRVKAWVGKQLQRGDSKSVITLSRLMSIVSLICSTNCAQRMPSDFNAPIIKNADLLSRSTPTQSPFTGTSRTCSFDT
jgi:hypothetical protein